MGNAVGKLWYTVVETLTYTLALALILTLIVQRHLPGIQFTAVKQKSVTYSKPIDTRLTWLANPNPKLGTCIMRNCAMQNIDAEYSCGMEIGLWL